MIKQALGGRGCLCFAVSLVLKKRIPKSKGVALGLDFYRIVLQASIPPKGCNERHLSAEVPLAQYELPPAPALSVRGSHLRELVRTHVILIPGAS